MDARDFAATARSIVQHDDLELNEMANLTREDTGLDGVVYVSTVEGNHGPRVKWFPNRPQRDAPCLSVSISAVPDARNLGLTARIADAAAPNVKTWVTMNQISLLGFWNEGHSWTRQEVSAFFDSLVKHPGPG